MPSEAQLPTVFGGLLRLPRAPRTTFCPTSRAVEFLPVQRAVTTASAILIVEVRVARGHLRAVSEHVAEPEALIRVVQESPEHFSVIGSPSSGEYGALGVVKQRRVRMQPPARVSAARASCEDRSAGEG